LLAPSYAQLLTSVILRDKQIHDPQADRWKIDLDSRAVRPAKRFADEVRAGAHLQEVLGRAVEGIVAQPDRVQVLRDQFPIRSEHAGRRTCDGQAALKDGLATLNAMALSPEQLAALAELRTVTNTYGDLLVADAVHHVVSGRPEKAGEAMEAAAGVPPCGSPCPMLNCRPTPPRSARRPWPMPRSPPMWSSACRLTDGAGRSSARRAATS
jgi:hypothetical protein